MHNKQVNLTREVTYKILIQIYEGKVFFDSAFNKQVIKYKLDNNQKNIFII